MSSRAEPLSAVSSRGGWWGEEWVRLTAFAYRNLIMARRNVFFLFELTFWPGVAMISHGLLTRFLDLTPPMTAFILVGTVALSAVQVCQLDVAYAVLFDIWSKSMKHQFLTPVRIHHLALGSWLVGVGRGVIVWALMALIGSQAFGFDFLGAGALRVPLRDPAGEVFGVAISPGGRCLVSVTDRYRVWEAGTPKRRLEAGRAGAEQRAQAWHRLQAEVPRLLRSPRRLARFGLVASLHLGTVVVSAVTPRGRTERGCYGRGPR